MMHAITIRWDRPGVYFRSHWLPNSLNPTERIGEHSTLSGLHDAARRIVVNGYVEASGVYDVHGMAVGQLDSLLKVGGVEVAGRPRCAECGQDAQLSVGGLTKALEDGEDGLRKAAIVSVDVDALLKLKAEPVSEVNAKL